MKRAFVLLALLVLAVPVEAHGSLHGQGLPRQFTAPVQVDADNSTTISVLYQSPTGQNLSFEEGALFLFTGTASGAPIQVTLKHTDFEAATRLIAVWTFTPGATQVEGTLLPGAGEYSLVIETASTSPATLTFVFDHTDSFNEDCTCAPRWLSQQPRGAAGVFTVDTPQAGPFAARVLEPSAHRLRVDVYEPLRPDAVFPAGFRLLDTSENTDEDSPAVEHVVAWDAADGGRYFVVMTSLQDDGFASRTTPEEAPSPWHALIQVGPDASVGSPSPIGLALVAVALASLVSRSRR